MTYIATSLGVSILFYEGDNIEWFVQMAISKGGVVEIKKLDE